MCWQEIRHVIRGLERRLHRGDVELLGPLGRGLLSMGSSGVFRSGAVAIVVAGLLASPAAALTVTFSEQSSDPLQIAAADMDATLTFSLVDLNLSLEVTNLATGGLEPLTMGDIFFNGTAGSSITLISAPAHSVTGEFLFDVITEADVVGYGAFDFGVRSIRIGNGQNREIGTIGAGETANFEFLVSAGFNLADIHLEASTVTVLGDVESKAAALFKGADSEAYGINVAPEPGTAVLLATGLIGLGWHRRRHRS